jgi:hypothetical protein
MKQRLAVARAHCGSRLHETGKRDENASYLPRVFGPIAVALSVAAVARDLGQAQRTEHGAHPLHASADRSGDLAWVQLLIASSSTTANAIGLPSRRHSRDCL